MKIAFIGLGLMGRGMAENIMSAGFQITVWNRSPDKLEPFKNSAARIASTIADAVEDADVIITIVGDDDASRSVWLGDNGVLSSNLKPGAIAIESTTVSRGWIEALGRHCTDAGLQFLDCPVTGGPEGATSGQLNLLIGGDSNTILAVEPLLNTISKKIYHFGPVGAGTAYKLIVNSVGASYIAVLAEAMLMAEKAGLDLQTVAQALSTGSVASRATNANASKMAIDKHQDIALVAKWRCKDVSYGSEMAQDLGCYTPIILQAEKAFRQTVDSGLGEQNESAVLQVIKNNQFRKAD